MEKNMQNLASVQVELTSHAGVKRYVHEENYLKLATNTAGTYMPYFSKSISVNQIYVQCLILGVYMEKREEM